MTNVNNAPTADDDAFTVSEDSANNPFDVLDGDTDIDDDLLTISSVADPPHGTTLDNNTNVLYTPDPGYVGVDSFTYTVSDEMGGTDTATVSVTVTNVNDAPVADDDTFTVTEDTSNNSLEVLNGDVDVEGDLLTITTFTDPPRGTVVNQTTYVTYTPDPVSHTLMQTPGAIRLRSDVERKRMAGLDALARSSAGVGEKLYAADATRHTYARLGQLAGGLLDAGWPVIVDATFNQRWQRDLLREQAQARGVAFHILVFQLPVAILRERILKRSQQGRDASDADLAVLQHQIDSEEALADDEQAVIVSIDQKA